MLGWASRVRLSLATKLILGFLLVAIPSVSVLGGISFYVFRDLTVVNRQLQGINRSLEAMRDLETAVTWTMLPPDDIDEVRGKNLATPTEGKTANYFL